MTPKQFKAARDRLGLSVAQMAKALGVCQMQIRRMQITAGKDSHRQVQPTTERLIRAYLDGYRPADWPGEGPPRRRVRQMGPSGTRGPQ